jgi:hypothetical protein
MRRFCDVVSLSCAELDIVRGVRDSGVGLADKLRRNSTFFFDVDQYLVAEW